MVVSIFLHNLGRYALASNVTRCSLPYTAFSRLQVNIFRAQSSFSGREKNAPRRREQSFDQGDDAGGLREPPGYVASHRWIKPRPPSLALEEQMFGSTQKSSSSERKYMSTELVASVSGTPVKNGFSYPVLESLSEIPHITQHLLDNLGRMGLEELTPVQRHAISILSLEDSIPVGKADSPDLDRVVGQYDLMAAAQTGSGKTLAYLIPIINRLMRVYPYEAMQNNLKNPRCQHPIGLVLAPTRELVQQIRLVASQLSYRSFMRPVAVFGGEKPYRQQHMLSLGCHLAVATPGRLLDFLKQGLLNLENCRALVLDEADRMLDMGFEDQLREILESPEFRMPSARDSERQTCLFSATFPREVALLARSFLRGDRCISLTLTDQNASGAVVPEWGRSVANQGKASELSQLGHIVPREISQEFHFVDDSTPNALHTSLVSLVQRIINEAEQPSTTTDEKPSGQTPRVLIFCNRKAEVDHIDRILYKHGIRTRSLHGDKSQELRTKALNQFRTGATNVLVASSVAARGLDIPAVTAVINVGFPNAPEDYVHRIGRTGRMGHQGRAITIVDECLLADTSPSVLKGILSIVKSSTGSLNDIPEAIKQRTKGPETKSPMRKGSPRYDRFARHSRRY